jgi:hypothetical protein
MVLYPGGAEAEDRFEKRLRGASGLVEARKR